MMFPWVSQPSLPWAVFCLTGQWPTEGKKITCPCPGHVDTNPSFSVYEQGEDYAYRCWACGISGGDAASLLADVIGLTGSDLEAALERLHDQEKNEWPGSVRSPKRRKPTQQDLSARWATIDRRLIPEAMDRFVSYLDAKGLPEPEYLNEEWDWMPADKPWTAVACPHWGPSANRLTGIKYRSLTSKSSEPGSSYPFLYGTWRDRGCENVVLAEGETDTVCAASQLRDVSNVEVFGLPSGAQQPIQYEWLKRLKGRRLFLVFDSDAAGRQATSAWKALFPSAQVARLPEGADLLSSGISLRSLEWDQ